MNLAAALLLGHLIADFPLQTAWIYEYKTKSWLGILIHSAIHVLVTACLIRPFYAIIPLLIWLGLLHFLTDFSKVRLPAKRQTPGFLLDQIVHIGVLLLLTKIWQGGVAATLPLSVLLPLIIYNLLLGTMVFLWVLACDLTQGGWNDHAVVQWSRTNLLKLSQYAGLALFFFLAQSGGKALTRSTAQ